MSNVKIQCPRCPVCSSRPVPHLPINVDQAFCGNDDCHIIAWEPGKSLDDNLTGPVTFHDLSGWPTTDREES